MASNSSPYFRNIGFQNLGRFKFCSHECIVKSSNNFLVQKIFASSNYETQRSDSCNVSYMINEIQTSVQKYYKKNMVDSRLQKDITLNFHGLIHSLFLPHHWAMESRSSCSSCASSMWLVILNIFVICED